MNQEEQIAFRNLQGEVTVLREVLRAVAEHLMPADQHSSVALKEAVDRARATAERLSPERISIDHAINQLMPFNWHSKR